MTIDFDIPFIYGCTDLWAGNFDPSANSDDGSCDYTCDEPSLSSPIIVNSSQYSEEIGWSIQTIDGEIIIEALPGFASPYNSADFSENGLCLSPGCYMLVMTDTYGDGWNGNTLSMFGDTYFIPSTGFTIYDGGSYQEVLFEIEMVDAVIILDVLIKQHLIIMKVLFKMMVHVPMIVQFSRMHSMNPLL